MLKPLVQPPIKTKFKQFPRTAVRVGKDVYQLTPEEYNIFLREGIASIKQKYVPQKTKEMEELEKEREKEMERKKEIDRELEERKRKEMEKPKEVDKIAELEKRLGDRVKPKQNPKALVIAPVYKDVNIDVNKSYVDRAKQICSILAINYQVTSLFGEEATGKNIIDQLKKISKEDGFLVYFTGVSMWFEEIERLPNEIMVTADDMIITWDDVKDLFEKNCTLFINADTDDKITPVQPNVTKVIQKPANFSFVDYYNQNSGRYQLQEILTLLRTP